MHSGVQAMTLPAIAASTPDDAGIDCNIVVAAQHDRISTSLEAGEAAIQYPHGPRAN
ncbi:MAG: hypothetical protein LBV45_10635 [Xanthomonadaceae bacterium]|nr:hypothetical protein [Xanthomonadaceae bacterium]